MHSRKTGDDDMANYANQKTIYLIELNKIVHKEGDKHNRFIQPIDFKYEAAAMRHLNGNAFKLWRYLLRWYGNPQRYDYSPSALCKELGMGKNGPAAAFDELERWGYITKDEDKNNGYIFTPVLQCDYLELKDKNDF